MTQPSLIPESIKNAVIQDRQKVQDYYDSFKRLANSVEWKLMLTVLASLRDEIVEHIKVDHEYRDDWVNKLVAIDLMRTLPQDFVGEMLGMLQLSMSDVDQSDFGFIIPDTEAPSTTLHGGNTPKQPSPEGGNH